MNTMAGLQDDHDQGISSIPSSRPEKIRDQDPLLLPILSLLYAKMPQMPQMPNPLFGILVRVGLHFFL